MTLLFKELIRDFLFKEYDTLLYFFSWQVLVRMRQYKDDLLASCLQLLLSLPNELVECEIDALVPALQVRSGTR